MQELSFSKEEIQCRNYIGESGVDDAVGIWQDNGYTLICFPNLDSIRVIKDMQKLSGGTELTVLINEQTFYDQNLLVSSQVKNYLDSAVTSYYLRSLNLRGPGALPVRGILYRKYPENFMVSSYTSFAIIYSTCE
jgi:hypothetical protein